MSERYKVSEVINFDPDQFFEVTLLHDITYEELIRDTVKTEDKLIASKYPDYKMVTEEEIQDAIDFMYKYQEEKCSERPLEDYRQELMEKLLARALQEKAMNDPNLQEFMVNVMKKEDSE